MIKFNSKGYFQENRLNMYNKCGSIESYLSFFHMFELMISTSIIFLSARNKTRIPGLRKKALCCFKSYVTAISMSGKMVSGLQNKNLAPQSEHEYSLKEIKMPGWKLSLNTPLMKNLKNQLSFLQNQFNLTCCTGHFAASRKLSFK